MLAPPQFALQKRLLPMTLWLYAQIVCGQHWHAAQVMQGVLTVFRPAGCTYLCKNFALDLTGSATMDAFRLLFIGVGLSLWSFDTPCFHWHALSGRSR
jgi:hypothetical protein